MKVLLVAAPYDSGHYRQRLGLGPSVLSRGAEDYLTGKGHIIRKNEILVDTLFPTEVTTSFEVSREIAAQVRQAKERGEFPIIFTGNCNTAAIGTLSGLQQEAGVIWFDCHGDFNTPETTIGGFLDGMAIAMITGQCWKQLTASVPGFKAVPEEKVILVGARDFDPIEMERLNNSRITRITPQMIRQNDGVLSERFVPMKSVYLHVDLDVLDPKHIHVNTYSTAGGLFPDDLYRVVKLVRSKYQLSAVAFTAYDPSLDPEGKAQEIVNTVIEIIINK